MADHRHLRKHWNQYYLQVRVPSHLVPLVGVKIYTRPLGTTDLRQARVLRDVALGRLRAAWQRLKSDTGKLPKSDPQWLLSMLDALREEVRNGADTDVVDDQIMIAIEHFEAARRGVDPPPETIEKIRTAVSAVAKPNQLTLQEAIDVYLAEVKPRVRPSTYTQKTKRLAMLTDHFGGRTPIEGIARAAAGTFTTTVVQKRPWSVKTKKDVLSDYSAFWNWCDPRGITPSNVWSRLSGTVRDSTRGRVKNRAWTESELLTILNHVDGTLLHFTTVALYSGMRLEEISQIRVEHVREGMIEVVAGKSDAAVRSVPVHEILRSLVKRLVRASDDGFLLSGLTAVGENQRRGHYVGKRFAAARESIEITGVRFHDLRRNFTEALERAQVPESTTRLLIGHARSSLTYGRYSSGIPMKDRAAAIAKVSHGRKVDAAVRKLIS